MATVLLASCALVGLAAPAQANSDVDQAAAELLAGASVTSSPNAEFALSPAEVQELTDDIAATGAPIFIAVLPASAGAGDEVLVELRDAVGLSGTYAVLVGDEFRAASDAGGAAEAATAAFRAHQAEGITAVLRGFITLVAAPAGGAATAAPDAAPGAASDDEGSLLGSLLFWLFGLAVVGGIVALVIVGRRRRGNDLAAVRAALDEELTDLGNQIAALDTSTSDTAREAADRALNAYERARTAADRMTSTDGAAQVTAALDEGRYALACATAPKAPARKPACLIDPRHGSSAGTAAWSPAGLSARTIPACASCLPQVKSGASPRAREVRAKGGAQPYWQAGPAFRGYARGYFPNDVDRLFAGTALIEVAESTASSARQTTTPTPTPTPTPKVARTATTSQPTGDFASGKVGGGNFSGGEPSRGPGRARRPGRGKSAQD
jgi:hypothetical protein